MHDPNEDNEWNDILRKHGIIPAKPEEPEEEVLDPREMPQKVFLSDEKSRIISDLSLQELNEAEDQIEEDELYALRKKRMKQLVIMKSKAKFGEVYEITAVNYVQEVNKASEDVWVILHLYQHRVELCIHINNAMAQAAIKYPHLKFIKSISDTCIQNYPESSLPTIFVYRNSSLIHAINAQNFTRYGKEFSLKDLEWFLQTNSIIETEMNQDPRTEMENQKVSKNSFYSGRYSRKTTSDDDDDY